ncbi:siphovirus Gp157 family protein, partial [Escherichia coli]|uniref:siphovirus Gp157 family protein n=1 Tax=Escherichia coli TaxID=562 RepID=UPI0022F308FE
LSVALILAVEEAEQQAEANVRAAQAALADVRAVLTTCRAALAEVIEETGLPSVETPHHRATTSVSARSVVITDAAALPAAYLRHRAPEPNKDALRKALLAGESIPGAALSNGAPSIRITAKKD